MKRSPNLLSSRPLLALMLFGATVASPVEAAVLQFYLDEQVLTELAQASSRARLEEIYKSLPYRDPAIEIVHSSRLLTLQPGQEAESSLLATIPTNPLHLWYFYSITYTDAYKRSPELAAVVNGYFERLARIIATRKDKVREFLLLSRFSDGELASDLADWNDFLKGATPKEFKAAVRSLDAEGRRRVCGDCAFLSEKE